MRIELSSPAFTTGKEQEKTIPGRYTCDAASSSLPFRWSAIPSGTVELVLAIVNFEAQPATPGKPFVDWALARIDPALRAISEGVLPSGALIGRNSFGHSRYSVCPPRDHLQHYLVALYALPHRLMTRKGEDAATLYVEARRTAKFEGLTGFYYERT